MFNLLFARTARSSFVRRLSALALFAGMSLAAMAASAPAAMGQSSGSPDLVISQVYTRGGEPGATFRNDYIEIFNRGNVAVDLTDYSLQYMAIFPASPAVWLREVPVSSRPEAA